MAIYIKKSHQQKSNIHKSKSLIKKKVTPLEDKLVSLAKKEENATILPKGPKKTSPVYEKAIIWVCYDCISFKQDVNQSILGEGLLNKRFKIFGKSVSINKNLSNPAQPLDNLGFIKDNKHSYAHKNASFAYKPGKRPKALFHGKPKLFIIIDDLAQPNQVRLFKSAKMKLNPSFLPPTKEHPLSAKLARGFPFFIVHLPMQALHYNAPEPNTLKVHDSSARIVATLKRIKREFGDVRFINNHTGSRFTSNTPAMSRLYKAMRAQNIYFIDSRTIANSKASRLAHRFGLPYLSRDIFLDNNDDIDYIKNQLRRAMSVARKRGFAIAIGHPRTKTIQALIEIKPELKGFELCYIDELMADFRAK